MPLEKFFSGEQPINVKDLTIEKPEKQEEPWFDPEKEITEKDWQKIKELVEHQEYKNVNSLAGFGAEMGNLRSAKILSPERFAEFNIDKENILAKIKERFKEGKSSGLNTLLVLPSLKQVFPEKASEIESYYDWDEEKGYLTKLRQKKEWIDFMEIACTLKMLHPERTTELGLDDEAWSGIKRRLTKWEDERDLVWARQAARVRLLYPEKFGELEIGQDQITFVKEQFSLLRETHNTTFFLDHAARLKILAAEEAYIDDNGMIVVNMRKKQKPELEPETPPMPERRMF